MARNQTRRSVSLSRAVHAAASEVAAAEGVPLSEWVTRLIRAAIPGLVQFNELADRGEVALDTRNAAEIRADFEARAAANPCRQDRCSIIGLHPAHAEGL